MKAKPISTVCAGEKMERMVSYIYITPFILKDPKALRKPHMEVTSAFAEIGTVVRNMPTLLTSRNSTAARQLGTKGETGGQKSICKATDNLLGKDVG